MYRIFLLLFIMFFSIVASGQRKKLRNLNSPISTLEDRAALYDYIYQKTLEREAFSPIKEENLGVDVKVEMQNCKNDIVHATNEEELFFALKKLSAARFDRHLDIQTIEGGLEIPSTQLDQAPIRFVADFSDDDNFFVFVGDYGESLLNYETLKPTIGDKLISVNGQPFMEYYNKAEVYTRYSTVNNLKRRIAYNLSYRSFTYLPSSFYMERLELELERLDGTRYHLVLPYLSSDEIKWRGIDKPLYPGFKKVMQRESFHVHRPINKDSEVILLWWNGFRKDLEKDVDDLIEYASNNNILDHDLIIDMTHSRGGSKGVYALQRLSPKPFKTTFGNLKLSDMAEDFIERKESEFERSGSLGKNTTEKTPDDGSWLIDWLRTDVKYGIDNGQAYSNVVPFKCAHAPKYSDGIIKPAEQHFRGNMVCFFGPWGGSHLDQFASIVFDNKLAYTLGMPCGGYSNTWEGEEVLHFPISGKPVVNYMWSIGHTIRPNGQILEGNPSDVDEYIPLTRDNYKVYYKILLDHAYKWLYEQ